MRIHEARPGRAEYLRMQIERSNAKFDYCKVSAADVRRYREILARVDNGANPQQPGPMICLGTRNGREVDLFRIEFHGTRWQMWLSRALDNRSHSVRSRLQSLEGTQRSNLSSIDHRSVLGVEVNPRAARQDVWIGSFDEMPDAWSHRFGVVYSNSFDQSQDPGRTAREWCRITRPGGYLIICFSSRAAPTPTDPVGDLTLDDVRRLFPGDLVYFRERGSDAGYSEVILRTSAGAGADARPSGEGS